MLTDAFFVACAIIIGAAYALGALAFFDVL